jgi:hypothetical protein
MNIIITEHSLKRYTNTKLSDLDLIIFIEKVLKDFDLKENGFYKFYYDHIVFVLKKEDLNIVLITIYPKKSHSYIMLNLNFDKKECFFQGIDENNRIGQLIPQINKKRKKINKKRNKKIICIKLKSEYLSLINNKTHEFRKFRIRNKNLEIFKKNIFISEDIIKEVRYILYPISGSSFYIYAFDKNQKFIKTFFKCDFDKYIKELD